MVNCRFFLYLTKYLVVDTTNEKYDFSGVSGPNGDDGAGSVCTTTATDADPDNGTDNYADSVAAMDGDMTKRQAHGTRFQARRAARV